VTTPVATLHLGNSASIRYGFGSVWLTSLQSGKSFNCAKVAQTRFATSLSANRWCVRVGKVLIDFGCDMEFLTGDNDGDVIGLESCCEFGGGGAVLYIGFCAVGVGVGGV